MSASDRPVIRVSSSIANFRQKLLRRTGAHEWSLSRPYDKCVFFGLYTNGDYLALQLHRGKKSVFFCGSDIKILTKKRAAALTGIRCVCENVVEQEALKSWGIDAQMHPMLFDSMPTLRDRYRGAITPNVYLSAHEDREEEYGVSLVREIAPLLPGVRFHIFGVLGENFPNLTYYGKISNDLFNDMICHFQCGLRPNTFDGASEVMVKSVLLGQYPISRIPYEFIDSYETKEDLITLLQNLKYKYEPNWEAQLWWADRLQKSLFEVFC